MDMTRMYLKMMSTVLLVGMCMCGEITLKFGDGEARRCNIEVVKEFEILETLLEALGEDQEDKDIPTIGMSSA